MHELHLIKDIFDDLRKIADREQTKKVTTIYFRMGDFSEINEEILSHFFEDNARGTIFEGAKIVIEKSPDRELRLLSFDCE